MGYFISKICPVTMCIITPVIYFSANRKPNTVKIPVADSGFVVLELFTSQGCSSCPPADNLLAKYVLKNNDHIIPLAFHVDYWNRLGWTDTFSAAMYSARQNDYASLLNSSVYTPQLIINGIKEFVGSDESKILHAVANGMKNKPAITIQINKIIKAGLLLSVDYILDKMYSNLSLHAALLQNKASTNIRKGENKGLELINYNVVRDFKTVAVISTVSTIDLQLPAGYSGKDFFIALCIQENATGKITGAVKKQL